MRKLLVSLILLVACGSDGPSTELATIYDYSLTLGQPPGANCTGTGVLDFGADTLGISTECSAGSTSHANVPLTNVAQDGARLTFQAWDCGHTGTIADEEINGKQRGGCSRLSSISVSLLNHSAGPRHLSISSPCIDRHPVAPHSLGRSSAQHDS